MVEHTVQNDPDAPFLCLGAEGLEVLLVAQQGIDLRVIGCIVAVIGGGFKNGTHVQGGHAQCRQFVQFFGDPRQRTAEKVPVPHLAVRIGPPGRGVLPVLVDPPVAYQSRRVRHRQPPKSIWKNLVYHAAAVPVRCMASAVDGKLPGQGLAVAAVTGLVQVAAGTVIPPEAEVVPDQLRLLRGLEHGGKAHPVTPKTGGGQLHLLALPGKFPVQHQGAVGKALAGQGAAGKGDLLAADRGAEGGLAKVTTGVKNERFTHEKGLLVVD